MNKSPIDPSGLYLDKEPLFRLVELFAPTDSDKTTIRKEFDKALEETKERVKNGMDNITLD